MPEKTELLVNKSEFPQLIDSALSDWQKVWDIVQLPYASGIYVIYGYKNEEIICLYVGQAENIRFRLKHHWAWQDAKKRYDFAHITYKKISRVHFEDLNHELIIHECLLIGLLRPIWNVATPPPRNFYHDKSGYWMTKQGLIYVR